MSMQPSGTVTFLLTDIEGSTQLWANHPGAMARALKRHDSVLREILENHGGYIFKIEGDAFCAAYTTATAAAAAAVEVQRAITREDWSAFGEGFPAMRIRMALHTGEVQVRDQVYVGAAVKRAARLETAANGGQILLSSATERLLRERLPAEASVRDLGRQRLKDLRYEEHVFQLVAPGMPEVPAELRTGGAVRVENPTGLALPEGAEAIVARLFPASWRVVLLEELAGGFSGSRVFKVQPFRSEDEQAQPAVVKLAPAGLIQQEYDGYLARIRGQLSGIPEIYGRPAFAKGGRTSGLRYSLVGGALFDIESLLRYWGRAELNDLVHVLESRLFVHLDALWRRAESRPMRLKDSYDHLLPANLVLSVSSEDAAADASWPALTPASNFEHDGSPSLGAHVRVSGFIVEEVDLDARELTLDLPTAKTPGGAAWRIRLEQVPDAGRWQVGDVLDPPMAVEVTSTRARRLGDELEQALGPAIDLDAEVLTVRGGPGALVVPNPLLALSALLEEEHRVRVGNVHGDLNLENVLVDPEARTVHLIDFALAREDHVLHDLLRLEASVLTRVLPPILEEAKLPETAAIALLHGVYTAPGDDPDEPALRSVHVGLVALRRAAVDLLGRPGDWREYHTGLIAYLLGASKYRNLGAAAKRTAFWAAASAAELARSSSTGDATALSAAMTTLLERVPVLEAYRRGRIAEWSGPRYELDDRFVALQLLIDQGEEAVQGRWQPKEERYDSLHALLESAEDPALVLLGPPGSGKSTILRELELSIAMEALRGSDQPLTFFLQLNEYRPVQPGGTLPEPGAWLSERWEARHPGLPSMEVLLSEGRVLFLLDALNEMPAQSLSGFRLQVRSWRKWLLELVRSTPGNRVVFSCRSLDYSQPLSTPALRVPQVRIEPMSDAEIERFLRAYMPDRFETVWDELQGSAQLEVLRSPYFLKLLVDQVQLSGELPRGRAGLFTSFVRQALRREIERESLLFEPGQLLTNRDVGRVRGWRWRDAFDLPERGILLPKLASLAHAMQEGSDAGERSQVRADMGSVREMLDSDVDREILAAGEALAILDEDEAASELMYVHQLVQEYFAARVLARRPEPDLVQTAWHSDEIVPTLSESLEELALSEPFPTLPQSGWEETTLLAAAMTEDPLAFLRGLMRSNLALAGRAAAQPEMKERLTHATLHDLRSALVERSCDPSADLRYRIECSRRAGELGDPRLGQRRGPYGPFLLGRMVEIPSGSYPIGSDEPTRWNVPGMAERHEGMQHIPEHRVRINAFRIGAHPVTRSEWRYFLEAGGYEDPTWWDTPDAERWRRGELANEGAKANNRLWRDRFRSEPDLIDQLRAEGRIPNDDLVDQWRAWIAMSDDEFEAALDLRWQGSPKQGPAHWEEARFQGANLPVVGVSWYEARAYCRWLSAQTGRRFRLPTEVEWEAAAAGVEGRPYPWGNDLHPLRANYYETRLRGPTPIGVFVDGNTPEGVSDLSGNVNEWTSSLLGTKREPDAVNEYRYPYDPRDGREDEQASALVLRVIRGGAFLDGHTHSFARGALLPTMRGVGSGLRLAADPADG